MRPKHAYSLEEYERCFFFYQEDVCKSSYHPSTTMNDTGNFSEKNIYVRGYKVPLEG